MDIADIPHFPYVDKKRQLIQKAQDHNAWMGTHGKPHHSKAFQPNGLLPSETTSVIRPIDPVHWEKAEERTAELIYRIQPNRSSEKHRNAVASYVQDLITKCIHCQVFTFGSVPLKTYLPDGDIDLTVFSEDQNLKDSCAKEVRDMLEREEKNEHAEFQVKEVQYIQAEPYRMNSDCVIELVISLLIAIKLKDVKIIKCLVDNIVVDISFNQLGGLCTLCFLEEVLYRFLEFFSKFDWTNFCVSLSGPVPLTSLPGMTANPPRKDGGELLLNKMFLSACSTAYSVFPGGQETQEQPFITKHFNVIDPLRLNNNLGRSVSKGNFYRIRSAFGFGAQQLARILECREENVVAAVNQFFVNTWDRHGEGRRPDAPIIDASHVRQVEPKTGGNLRKHLRTKQHMGNSITCVPEIDQSHSSLNSSSQCGIFPKNPVARTADASEDVLPHKQKDYNDLTNQVVSSWDDEYSQGHDLIKKTQDDRGADYKTNIVQNRGRAKHQFARTYSSPELANISSEASQYMHMLPEKVKKDMSLLSNNPRCTKGSCILENHVINHTADRTSIRESSKSRATTFNSNHASGIYVGDSVAGYLPPVCSSGDYSSQTHQEEQDIMTLMSPAGIQNYGGHVRMPMKLSSHHLVQIPPSVLGYSHQIFAGTVTPYTVDSGWGTVKHRGDGPPFPLHFNAVGVRADHADVVGQLNGTGVSAEFEQDDDCGFWTDSVADSSKEIDPASENFSAASSIVSPASPATSSRTKTSSESSWDGKPSKMTTTVKYHSGKKTRGSRRNIGSDNNGWQDDGECIDKSYSDVDDDHEDWAPVSTAESVASSVTSSHFDVQRLPGIGPVHMSYPTSVLPFAPVLVRPGPEQSLTHNHGVVAFYPAGPPVPFVTMVPIQPIYNTPAETSTSSVHARPRDMEPTKSTLPVPQSLHHLDSVKDLEQFSNTDNYHSVDRTATGEHSDEGGSDIFNSDFASHWKNLQYGRLCQISQLQHHFVYSPSVVVSPQHVQGDLSFNGSNKQSPRSTKFFSQVVPVAAQCGSSKSAGVPRRHGGDASKNRNGTGTYFPNPKILRDRQFSAPRQYRGDYNYDRSEYHEREANWNFPKSRFNGRAQARYHYEKPNSKMGQSAADASQTDGQWDTLQHNSSHSYRSPIGDVLPLVMLYHCYETISSVPYAELLKFGSVGPEQFVGTNGRAHSAYCARDDHQLQNYRANSGPPSPVYASPTSFPGFAAMISALEADGAEIPHIDGDYGMSSHLFHV
ncbi:hypothetical protein Cgig2_007932 [Carnegiea gigantea]|uniref:PAP/OAS1 substrate-binding-related domain-containing protein n=1 Tax=Carnegiea gigantea TaxID=171969 RepID=A0A9Q1QHL5_9CARY|nr:hypothetical protein Cgig2_007932 [Carnegiea gigantea]